ncbi:zinc ribbon domain-containing protein [Paraburkholderia acidisoli]|uniref:Zinc ribbon domain-containing protein n=1 Tax=Paraburkholderia acidisoli TaxID=2571748 RepID=A0A7Z2GQ45_9BURK|nr:zinc ribbon domain-containing protein [Paraburkholderia acidisoli]QGZ65494.1 zinc ribbon domain-containing protein [Paraburkholderia acidisoli]
MSAQTIRDQSFPAACKRCGGVLYQVVDFCPYCGTNRPLETVALDPHAKIALGPLGPTPPPSPAATKPAAHRMPDPDHPSVQPDFQHGPYDAGAQTWPTGRRIYTKGILLVAFVLAIAVAAHLLIGGNGGPDDRAHSTGGAISAFLGRHQPDTPPAATDTAAKSATPAFTDVPSSLRAARASLAENNLAGAIAANNAALAHEADNDDAHAIQRDIAARTQRRDTALRNADQCATQHAWACVQQQASDALAIDSSSAQAQSLMERAILQTGWTPLAAQKPGTAPTAPSGAAPAVVATRAAPGTAGPASGDNSVEAQQRAIVQSGWRNAPAQPAH